MHAATAASFARSHFPNLVSPSSKTHFQVHTSRDSPCQQHLLSTPRRLNSHDLAHHRHQPNGANFGKVSAGMNLEENHYGAHVAVPFLPGFVSPFYSPPSQPLSSSPARPVGIPSPDYLENARRQHDQINNFQQHQQLQLQQHHQLLQVQTLHPHQQQQQPSHHHRQAHQDRRTQVADVSTSSVGHARAVVPKRDRSGTTTDKLGTLLPTKKVLKKILTSSSAPPKKVRSSKSNIPGTSRYWTPSEHKLFVLALLKYGPKDLKSIASFVGTRNMIQCRTHEQKCFMRLMREAQRETELRGVGETVIDDVQTRSPVDAEYVEVESVEGADQIPNLTISSATSSAATAAGPSGGTCSSSSSVTSEIPGLDKDVPLTLLNGCKQGKDVYSVSSSCGITLLCVVGEEMSRALSC